MYQNTHVTVWDPLVRIFHWTLVTTFFIAYFTEEDLLTLHVWAGYILVSVLILRIIWGFVGTQHARFSDFVVAPSVAYQYLKDTFYLRARRYLGHNPAGGFMIVVMLILLVLIGASGLLVYGADKHAGPLASLFVGGGKQWKEPLEIVHEFLANFMLAMVIIHVAGVVVESKIHNEHLARAMVTGLKKGERI
jgi:cytochrome b